MRRVAIPHPDGSGAWICSFPETPSEEFRPQDQMIYDLGMELHSVQEQLADMKDQRDRAIDTAATRENEIIELETQIESYKKMVVNLRLAATISKSMVYFVSGSAEYEMGRLNKALDESIDLKDYILCTKPPHPISDEEANALLDDWALVTGTTFFYDETLREVSRTDLISLIRLISSRYI